MCSDVKTYFYSIHDFKVFIKFLNSNSSKTIIVIIHLKMITQLNDRILIYMFMY